MRRDGPALTKSAAPAGGPTVQRTLEVHERNNTSAADWACWQVVSRMNLGRAGVLVSRIKFGARVLAAVVGGIRRKWLK